VNSLAERKHRMRFSPGSDGGSLPSAILRQYDEDEFPLIAFRQRHLLWVRLPAFFENGDGESPVRM